jgi:hypothetical protein
MERQTLWLSKHLAILLWKKIFSYSKADANKSRVAVFGPTSPTGCWRPLFNTLAVNLSGINRALHYVPSIFYLSLMSVGVLPPSPLRYTPRW